MKLYIVTNETSKRFVLASNAYNARRLVIESCIGGHKIDRRVWRTSEGTILELNEPIGVISEETAIALLRRYGYNLDGTEYKVPTATRTGRRGRRKAAPPDRKVCRRCGIEKPIADFPVRSGGGYQSYCRDCKIIIDREYRRNKKSGG